MVLIFLLSLLSFSHAIAGMGPLKEETSIEKFHKPIELPPTIKSINIFSGIPLTGAGDNSGGFGDVAANVTSALHLAESRPDLKINFVVISQGASETRKLDATSEKIVEIMVPGLNSQLKDVPQKQNGINFIFLSNNPIIKSKQQADVIKNKIPQTDVALMYSADPKLMPILRSTAKLAFLVREPSGYNQRTADVVSHQAELLGEESKSRLGLTMNSGSKSMGFYLPSVRHPPLVSGNNSRDRKQSISQELNALGISEAIDPGAVFGFAYTKNFGPLKTYLQAVSELAKKDSSKGKNYTVFVKNFPEMDSISLPPNLHLVKLKGISDSLMDKLIWESDLPPLVTGDGSLSKAISATNPKKGFLYEMNDWKKGSASALVSSIRGAFPEEYPESQASFKRLEKALTINPMGNSVTPQELVEIFEDPNLWETMHEAIRKQYYDWRLTDNILQSYNLLREFQPEILNLNQNGSDLLDMLMSLSMDSNYQRDPIRELQVSAVAAPNLELRGLATYTLLKRGDGSDPLVKKAVEKFFTDLNERHKNYASFDVTPQRCSSTWFESLETLAGLLRAGLHQENVAKNLRTVYLSSGKEVKDGIDITLEAVKKLLPPEEQHLTTIRFPLAVRPKSCTEITQLLAHKKKGGSPLSSTTPD